MTARGDISARTRLGAVLGWPVEHSFSPALQGAAIRAAGLDAVFLALPVRPEDLGDAARGLRAAGALGASVTVPHKQAVIAHCDRIDPLAERIGAVNCLAFEDGAIIGYNTDAGGFADSLHEELKICLRGLRPVILGSGGAARAVAAGLEEAGCEPAVVVARTPARAQWARKVRPWTRSGAAAALSRCDLLVDATSIGLDPERDKSADLWPLDPLPEQAAVATLIYHRETALLSAAKQRGHRVFDGAGMLVHQGARAFRLWTGIEPPVDAMWGAMREALALQRSSFKVKP